MKTAIAEIVIRGDEILRNSRPAQRQRYWREWRKQAMALVESAPELKNLGLELREETLAADVGILSRYDRHIQRQGAAVINQPPPQANNGTEILPKRTVLGASEEIGLVTSADRDSDTLNVFLSHKKEDEKTARGIKSALERYGAGRLKAFVSEDIPSGTKWFSWIQERLLEADLLLLIFTDATRTWDWCLYEAGLFSSVVDKKNRPLVCFHNKGIEAPAPLQHLQTVPAEEQALKAFLKQLFTESTYKNMSRPLNPALAGQPDELNRAAQEIVALISRKQVKIDFLTRYLFITAQYSEKVGIFPDSRVTADEKTLEIFGLAPGEWKWKDLLQQVSTDEDQRWTRELENAIAQAAQGRLFDPILTTFQSRRGNQRYRPILYRADTLADGSHVFKILLDEDLSWQHSEFPPPVRTLLSALSMAIRFRYEVLIKYFGHLANSEQQEPPKGGAIRTDLQASIRNIELEARSRGLRSRETLLEVFSETTEKKMLQKMQKDWAQIRKDIFDNSEKNNDDMLQDRLAQTLRMNQAFIKLGSSRLVQLIEKGKKQLGE